MRGADEQRVVVALGGVVGQAESLGEAFAADAGEKNFIRSGGAGGVAEDVAGFVVAEHNGFAGGAEDHEAGAGGAGVALDIGLELAQIESAIGIEGSGDRRKNTFEEHETILISNRKRGNWKDAESCCNPTRAL